MFGHYARPSSNFYEILVTVAQSREPDHSNRWCLRPFRSRDLLGLYPMWWDREVWCTFILFYARNDVPRELGKSPVFLLTVRSMSSIHLDGY